MVGSKRAVISSNIEELREYRDKAMEVCRRWDIGVEVWEGIAARGGPPKERMRELVDNADVYIGIIGHSYGQLVEGENVSGTEFEYKCAKGRGIEEIERIILIVDQDAKWLPQYIAQGDERERLDRFRASLSAENSYRTLSNIHEFEVELIYSLLDWSRRTDMVGPAQYESEWFSITNGTKYSRMHGLKKPKTWEVLRSPTPTGDEGLEKVVGDDWKIKVWRDIIEVTTPDERYVSGYLKVFVWE